MRPLSDDGTATGFDEELQEMVVLLCRTQDIRKPLKRRTRRRITVGKSCPAKAATPAFHYHSQGYCLIDIVVGL